MPHELFKREPQALTQASNRRELLRLLALSAGAWGLTAPFAAPSALAQTKVCRQLGHLETTGRLGKAFPKHQGVVD